MRSFKFFSALWCEKCKAVNIALMKLEDSIEIEQIDVSRNAKETMKYKIISIPTLIKLDDENEVDRLSGNIDKDKLLNWLSN